MVWRVKNKYLKEKILEIYIAIIYYDVDFLNLSFVRVVSKLVFLQPNYDLLSTKHIFLEAIIG